MTTGKCNDCGKERMAGAVRCAEHHAKFLRDLMTVTEEKQDHYTFPDDLEIEPRPGWGPFKFDWLLKFLKPFVEWHDRVTTKGSYAQKIGIPNTKINEYTEKQIEILTDKPKNGFQKRFGQLIGIFLKKVNRFFYEGRLR